ncbi:universal stress protein [Actinophytocola gossypii]|uniref:Universal stress protein n=1 Tax=Actinophytocola gossypii TaxID=2812003 RepID=A0ABT2JK87_9PSEU|nr:universal stress protein [Actinophytocola gossypii]MCT2587929.1 universal stress protein [Actinophytocola gossypii]
MRPDHDRVLVGVSTVDERLPMVRWAAAEAAARGAELRLVTAVPPATDLERHLPSNSTAAIHERARHRLTRATREAKSAHPELGVTAETTDGAPTDVLPDHGESADLLVVGADDRSPFAEAMSGSVPGTLLTTSPCPLAVVPKTVPPTTADAPVLAAIDQPGTSLAALAYAFAAAQRAHRPLRVLRCLPDGRLPDTSEHEHHLMVLGFGALHPAVSVSEVTVRGDPADVLATHSRRAALLVLGSRGRGRLASTLFGSVSRYLIRRSGCPVVVARSRSDSHTHLVGGEA